MPNTQALSVAKRIWVKVLAQELYGQPDDAIRTALKDKHPPRVIQELADRLERKSATIRVPERKRTRAPRASLPKLV